MEVYAHKHDILGAVSRELFTDLTLFTECGRSLHVHKVVAATVSSKIMKHLVAKETNKMTIRNVKYPALENIFNFVYNGKLMISQESDKQDFVAAFRHLKMNLGKKVEKLIEKLDSDVG